MIIDVCMYRGCSSLVRLAMAKQLSRHMKFVQLIDTITRVKLVYL